MSTDPALMSESKNFSAHDESKQVSPIKVDKRGLPLVPQPSDHPDDPLVSI